MQLRHDARALEWKQSHLKSTNDSIAQLGLDRNNSAFPSDVTTYWNSRNAREMRELLAAWTKIGQHVKLAANFTWNPLIKANYESIFCLPLHTVKSRHNLKQLNGPELTSSPVLQSQSSQIFIIISQSNRGQLLMCHPVSFFFVCFFSGSL